MEVTLNRKLKPFALEPWRYKVAYGGRGSAKSWTVARILLLKGQEQPLRILCAREIQNSIKDSVHKLLKDQMELLGLQGYTITDNAIRHINGTEFFFTGLYRNETKLKSFEAIDICWIEEAEAISAKSWQVLTPTIRKPGSEIWITLNLKYEEDIIYQTLIKEPPANAFVVKVNWQDNLYFPEVLVEEMETMRQTDYDLYLHIWEGHFKSASDAQVMRDKFEVKEFNIHSIKRLFKSDEPPLYGLDWGFAKDPLAIVRVHEINIDANTRDLYIDYEAGGVGVEIDHTRRYLKKVPGSKKYKIRADSARPESISLVRRQDYDIVSVDKWSGSVEDGIEYMRGYRKIYIHPRCVETAKEFVRYSYKIDKHSGDVLPKIEDKFNHYIDAIRYALTPRIKSKRKSTVKKKPARLRRV